MRGPNQEECEVALYCDESNVPEFCRVKISSLNEEKVPDAYLPILQAIKEHTLTVLRVLYRETTALAMVSSVWTFIPTGQPLSTGMVFQEFGEDILNVDAVKNLFVNSFKIREVLRLFQDGVSPIVPLQYRFLSFFKLLENHFLHANRWDYAGLDAMLKPHEHCFTSMGFTKTARVTIFDLRDRCAHIKSNKGVLGVTHLNHAAAVNVEKVLPYLRSVCAQIINIRSEGTFTMNTSTEQLGYALPSPEIGSPT